MLIIYLMHLFWYYAASEVENLAVW